MDPPSSSPAPRPSGGESARHRLLKRAALHWAYEAGFRIGAPEVRLPRSRYRVDVAAYRPGRTQFTRRPCAPSDRDDPIAALGIGESAVFECKQSRPDFLNDSHALHESMDRLRGLRGRLETLERLLGVHYPSLHRGDSLFPEFRECDLSRIDHEGHRQLVREISLLERRIFGRTKFDRLTRIGCANVHFVVAFEGILSVDEIPSGWGLLVAGSWEPDAPADAVPPLWEVRQAEFRPVPGPLRLEFLHATAAAAARETAKAHAVPRPQAFRPASDGHLPTDGPDPRHGIPTPR